MPNALWRRVFTAFGYGDVLITVGTGKLTEREEDDTGLIGQHDYTIIDMKEIEGKRLLLVKNPWSGGTTWKGRLNYDGCSTNDGLTKDEQKYKPENCGSSISERLAPGTFWMDLNDIFQNFDTMYLNWNPGLFPFREDIHFTWDLASSRSATGSFAHNPQFRLQSRHGGTAWLLLSRYFMNTNQVSLSHTSGSLPTPGASHGFISLYAFDNNGERVIIDEGAFVRAPYVDSPNTLIKLELLPSKSYTIVVSELEISALRYSFSLSAFALHPISIRKARNKYNYFLSKPGVWTLSSSGGNASGASYHKNPQFSIKVPITSDICLLLETSNEQFPVHIKLVWGGGKALSSITTRDIVCDSGKYRQGCAVAEMSNVQAGAYTIVCSTFDQGQLGKFNLHLSSTSDCTVDRILSAEAGRLVLSAPTALFSSGRDRLLVPLIPLRITRVSLMTRVPHERLASAKRFNSLLKVSIEHGQGPSKRVLAVSGNDEFLDNRSGIQTKEVDVDPNMCSHRGLWIVLERLGGLESPNDEVNVEILSDEPIELGAWGEGNG